MVSPRYIRIKKGSRSPQQTHQRKPCQGALL